MVELTESGVEPGVAYRDAWSDPAVLARADHWNLLLQLDSDEAGPGWMWGDVGRLCFWIRDEDLAARRFERVWMQLQCY